LVDFGRALTRDEVADHASWEDLCKNEMRSAETMCAP
jgi:hypothetical protein